MDPYRWSTRETNSEHIYVRVDEIIKSVLLFLRKTISTCFVQHSNNGYLHILVLRCINWLQERRIWTWVRRFHTIVAIVDACTIPGSLSSVLGTFLPIIVRSSFKMLHLCYHESSNAALIFCRGIPHARTICTIKPVSLGLQKCTTVYSYVLQYWQSYMHILHVTLSSDTRNEILERAICPDDSYKIVHGTSHALEKVNYCAFSPCCKATCMVTGEIALMRPIPFNTATSAICGDAILSSLPSTQPVPFKSLVPSDIITVHVDKVSNVFFPLVTNLPVVGSVFTLMYVRCETFSHV